jgi:hypothetical protein
LASLTKKGNLQKNSCLDNNLDLGFVKRKFSKYLKGFHASNIS